MKTTLFAVAACIATTAQAAPDCKTPAAINTVKMIFAENVITVAEQQMSIRYSLDRATSLAEIKAAQSKLLASLAVKNIRTTDPRGDGFPVWCAGDISLVSAPQYPLQVEYRIREAAEHPGGLLTQAKATLPPGEVGFNLLILMRNMLVSAIPEEYRTKAINTTEAAQPVAERKRKPTPSFNCEQAMSTAQKLICGNDSLAQQDADVRAVFDGVRQRAMDTNESRERVYELANTHRKWQSERDSCQSETCLIETLGARRKVLESLNH